VVPLQAELLLAETDLFMEDHDWSLSNHSPQLSPQEFSVAQTANTFEIDLDGKVLTIQFSDHSSQLLLDIPVEGWTEQTLVLFLDKQLRDASIGQSDRIAWLTKVVAYLTGPRSIALSALMQCKYPLARRLKDRLSRIRKAERTSVYQRNLFAAEAKPELSFDHGFRFRDGLFADTRKYQGSYKFIHHFTGWDQVPAFDGDEKGEEFKCAQALDSLPQVKHWVRNVSQHRDAFWLPRAEMRFYPDFVAELKDERIMLVEYKGAHLATGEETDEKRAIGQLWEQLSKGSGLFVIAEKSVNGKDVRTQMLDKVEP